MKGSYPLSFKISLWLLLNLLLLAVAGVGVYWSQFGRGWDSVLQGAMGDRLQAVADNIMAEGLSGGTSALQAALAAREENTGAEFFVFRNEGTQVFGRPVRLPEKLLTEMVRGPRRGPPGEGPPGDRPPPGKKG
ncbi:MAG TPA: sensor histidine kinase, partial [Opitutaceae bacterium]